MLSLTFITLFIIHPVLKLSFIYSILNNYETMLRNLTFGIEKNYFYQISKHQANIIC